jgi:hypothetical protein
MRPVILDALFWIAVAGCAVAQFFILRAVLRTPASRPMDSPSPLNQTAGGGAEGGLPVRAQSGRVQEIVWAVLPSLLLGAAFVLAWRAMHPAAPAAAFVLVK